jgi:Multiubiquitin
MKEQLNCDDQDETVHENRAYRIKFALDNLNFRSIEVADPIPLGRQILAAAGLDARGEHSLFAILPSGDFEDIRLDEPFDLRGRGVEQFVAFRTDRDLKLTLDDRQIAWGKPAMRGFDLYQLANVSNEQAVFLEIRGGTDKLIDRALYHCASSDTRGRNYRQRPTQISVRPQRNV